MSVKLFLTITERTSSESVREQGADVDVWVFDGRGNWRVEETAWRGTD